MVSFESGDYIRNKIFQLVTRAARKKKSECAQQESNLYDLLTIILGR